MERKIFNMSNVIENLNVYASNSDIVVKSDTINYMLIKSANEVDVVEGLDSISINDKSSGNISINNGSINDCSINIKGLSNCNCVIGSGNTIYSNGNGNNNIIIGDGNVVGSSIQNDIEIIVPKNYKINNLNIKSAVSDLKVYNLNLSTLKVKVDTGNINVLNTEFNKGNLKTNTGNITVELLKDYKQWIIEAKTNCGLVHLPPNFSSYDSNKKLKIKVDCGNIDVK